MEMQLVEDVGSVEASPRNFRHPIQVPIERVTLADIQHHRMTCYDVKNDNDLILQMTLTTFTMLLNEHFLLL
jgi:hypothetical protein